MNATTVESVPLPMITATSSCSAYTWCTDSGDHESHMGVVADVSSTRQGSLPHVRAWLHDLNGDGELTASVTYEGESDDFDIAGLRAHAVRVGAFAGQVMALADQLQAGTYSPDPTAITAKKPSTWTIAIEGGGQISGHLPPWIERSSAADFAEKPLRADRLGLLVDIDHWLSIEGVEMNVAGPGYEDPAEPEEILRGHLQVRPFDSDPASRVPHVDLEVVEGRWMENLGPADLADIADKLREQAARLDDTRQMLVEARIDWEANA
ncbi:hypothetical protein [Streptomyces sp. SID14515]|uniref:DUF6907 domain-containing protein n=1 Tax=Streptomyces sp. SID14515 TaxID=2706074 RepID=UPI0013C5FE61|nr:hypothetical protein [Streptomyces sp. SID14515]NEB41478.1 hypothetical protein [Streptomyces sp. SID14515]